MSLGQDNDPRRYNRQTREQAAHLVTSNAVIDDTLNVCWVCGTTEFESKLTDVGDGKLECVRCMHE